MKNKTEEHKLKERQRQKAYREKHKLEINARRREQRKQNKITQNKTIEQLHSLIDKHLTSQAIYENGTLLLLEDSIDNLKSEIVDLLTKK